MRKPFNLLVQFEKETNYDIPQRNEDEIRPIDPWLTELPGYIFVNRVFTSETFPELQMKSDFVVQTISIQCEFLDPDNKTIVFQLVGGNTQIQNFQEINVTIKDREDNALIPEFNFCFKGSLETIFDLRRQIVHIENIKTSNGRSFNIYLFNGK